MAAVRSVRKALAFGSALLAAGALSLVATAPPASATTTVLHGTVDCGNVNYSGDTWDWYPWTFSVTASPGGTLSVSPIAVPTTHAFRFDQTLPAGTTTVRVSALCSSGHQYDLYGTQQGISIPSGATSVTATWVCSTAPVSPGPWLTNCNVQSVSYT